MGKKREMLRRAAAFVSALSFLSVSNMGAFSAFAEETSTPSASSTASPADDSAPAKSGGSTVISTTTTTTSVTTTITTTVSEKEKLFQMPDNMGDLSKRLYYDIEKKIQESVVSIVPDNADRPTQFTIKYRPEKESDIKRALEKQLYYPPNYDDWFDRYTIDFEEGIITMNSYCKVNVNQNMIDETKFESVNGRYYLEKGSKIDGTFFKLDKYKKAVIPDGADTTVNGVLTVNDTGVRTSDNITIIEFADKEFEVNFKLTNVKYYDNSNSVTQNFKWSELEGKNIIIKVPDAHSSSKPVKFKVKGKTTADDKEYKFDGNQKNVGLKEIILSYLTQDTDNSIKIEDGKKIDLEILGIPKSVMLYKTLIDDNGNKKTSSEEIELSGSNEFEIPYIIQDEDGVTYYLSVYEKQLFWENQIVKTSYDSYDDIKAVIKNDGVVKKVKWDDWFNGIGPNGEQFIVEYKQIAEAEGSENTIMDMFYSKSSASPYMRKDNIIGIKKGSNFSIDLGEGTDYEGYTFQVATENNSLLSLTVTDGLISDSTTVNNKYLKFLTAEDKDGNVVPMQQFYIYLDSEKPVVEIAKDEQGGNWTNERKFELKISDNSGVDESVRDEDNTSVSEITIGDAVIQQPSSGKWVLNNLYSYTVAATADNPSYTVKLTPVKCEKGDTTFEVSIKLNGATGGALNSDLAITATDKAGLTSDKKTINVNLDNTKPTMSVFSIDGINEDNIIVNSYNRKIDIKLSAADEVVKAITEDGKEVYPNSGIKGDGGVIAYYSESRSISELDKAYSEKAQKNGDKYSVSFEMNNLDKDGYIIIQLTDNAGNVNYYYYSSENEGLITNNSSEATIIRSDETAPECPVIENDEDIVKPVTIESKDWFSDYPEFNISAKDNENGTGIKSLTVKINGVEKTIELTELESDDSGFDPEQLLKDGKFRIAFENAGADSTTFNPHLEVDGFILASDPLDGTEVSLRSGGELNIEVMSTDKADMNSENVSMTVYIDNHKPLVAGTFEADPVDSVHSPKYGNFSNHGVKIRIPIADLDEKNKNIGSSGFKKAAVSINCTYEDGQTKKINYNSDKIEISGNDIILTIPDDVVGEDHAAEMTITASVTDNVGNVSEAVAVQKNKHDLVIDKIKPVFENYSITSADGSENFYKTEVDGKTWVNGDAAVSYDISDPNSGLAKIEIAGGKEDKTNEYTADADITKSGTYTSETDPNKDGEFNFEFKAVDNAGNDARETPSIYKDNKRPEITGFSFKQADNVDKNGMADGSNKEKYRHFYNDENGVEMTVTAEDPESSSGIRYICVELYNPDGSVFDSKKFEFDESKNKQTATMFIPEGFKGDIVAWAVDNVEWESDKKSPNGYISENEEHHQNTADIKIERPHTDRKDNKGRDLYNDTVELTVTVSDPQTGIRDVEWTAPDKNGGVDIDNEGGLTNRKGEDDKWTAEDSDKERNILTKAVNKIQISKNDNGNEVNVLMHDYAGNIKSSKDEFSIDTLKPDIKVEGITESNTVQYFNTHKTAKVRIVERNFTAPVVNGSADTGFTHDPSTPEDADTTAYIKDFNFNSDGRYTLDITETDLAGNAEEKAYHSGTFVIDTTAPKASISVSKVGGGTVRTGDDAYVDSDVSVNVIVDEVNFDPDSTEITINGNAFNPGSWSGGSSHTAVIPASNFAKDGQYTISISGKDLAGNTLKPVTSSFTVDKKKPEIKITGVSSANNGEVAPVINITDDNLDAQDVKVYKNGKLLSSSVEKDGDVVSYNLTDGKRITGKWATDNYEKGIKKKMIFDNFPTEEEYDGSYRIDVESKDMAENENSESLDFSVNRFGSVFSIENADEINGKYLNKAPMIVITETNVDKHSDEDEVIIIVDKGSNTVQLTDNEYVISGPKELDDKSGYVYTYTIDPKNFDQDLDYNVSIQSVDAAGNKNVSSGRGADLSFSIDTHEPEFKCDELIDKAEFKESQREFKLNVNERLSHVKVTTSLNEVLLDRDGNDSGDNSYSFAVPASNTSRDLTVELTDLAGNSTVKTYNNLLITENIALYVMHKTWAKAGAAAAAALAAVAGGAVLIKKKKDN